MKTIYKELKENWKITKNEIKELGIDPEKDWEDIKLHELQFIADHLDVTISDLV